MDHFKETLKEIEKENQLGIEKAISLSRQELSGIRAQREFENKKFEEFKQIIDGSRYFRMSHFDQLNINYDIAIHLSAKNVGKTTELYRLINQCLKRNKKFIYGRVTVLELESEIEKFREDEHSPVRLIKHGTRYYFFKKSDIDKYQEENPESDVLTYNKMISFGAEVVGKGMTFIGSNTLGAGNYADYEMIFFDEIVPYTPKQYINERILYNWGVAVSTILRNKSKLTIIMMGNLQNNINSVPILDYYGIDIADNLRVITRTIGTNNKPCTILYINSGSLYNNALKNQAGVAHHASLDDRLFMEHNKIINTSTKVMSKAIIDNMKSVMSVGVEWDNEFWVLELKAHGSGNDKVYAMCVHDLTLTTCLEVPIYTNQLVISNKFSCVKYLSNIKPIYKTIYMLFSMHKLYYDCVRSLDVAGRCVDEVIRPEVEAAENGR